MGTSRSRKQRRVLARAVLAYQQNNDLPIMKLPNEITQKVLRFVVTDLDIRKDLSSPYFLYRQYHRLRLTCRSWCAQMDYVLDKWQKRRRHFINMYGFGIKCTDKTRKLLQLYNAARKTKDPAAQQALVDHEMCIARRKAHKRRKERKYAKRCHVKWQEKHKKNEKNGMEKYEQWSRRSQLKHYNSLIKDLVRTAEKRGVEFRDPGARAALD